MVLTVRLRACIRPLDEAPSASDHDGNPHVFAYSSTSASWALHVCQVWKTPVRPVRHHLTDNLRNSSASFSRRRLSGQPDAVIFSSSQQRPEYACIFVS